MRRATFALALAAFSLAAPPAFADGPATHRIKQLKGKRPFWGWLANPHGTEINVILERAAENLSMVRNDGLGQFSWSSGTLQPQVMHERERALDDALGMLHRARRLAPRNRRVISLIADVAVERGATSIALDALVTLRRLPGERGEPTFTREVALGRLYAQMGRWDAAALHLSNGLTNPIFAPDIPAAVFALALVEMERGKVSEAIDLVRNQSLAYDATAQLTLAVAYDRGEQENEASAILAQLRASQTLGAAISDQNAQPLRFAPAIDVHYFAGLALEAAGELGEARAHWQSYARARPQPRYRARALQHIADIDKLAAEPPPRKPARSGRNPPIPSPGP